MMSEQEGEVRGNKKPRYDIRGEASGKGVKGVQNHNNLADITYTGLLIVPRPR